MKKLLPLLLSDKRMSTLKLLFLALIIQTLQPAMANEKAPAEKGAKQELCKKTMKLKGAPNLMESVAHMRAIIIWSENVSKKYNGDYAQWHNAQNKSVKCKKSPGSAYYYCDLTATPCLSKTTENSSP